MYQIRLDECDKMNGLGRRLGDQGEFWIVLGVLGWSWAPWWWRSVGRRE